MLSGNVIVDVMARPVGFRKWELRLLEERGNCLFAVRSLLLTRR